MWTIRFYLTVIGFSRRYVHGLRIPFLNRYGLCDEAEVVSVLRDWLAIHPYTSIYANAPAKEQRLLRLSTNIHDVCLLPWKARGNCESHQVALAMKLNYVPICGTYCNAHRSVLWKAKCVHRPSATDVVKMAFPHHCSLYDCIECFFVLMYETSGGK